VVMPSAVASMAGLLLRWRWPSRGRARVVNRSPTWVGGGDRGAVGRRRLPGRRGVGCRQPAAVHGLTWRDAHGPSIGATRGEVCRAVCGGGPRFRGAGLVTFGPPPRAHRSHELRDRLAG